MFKVSLIESAPFQGINVEVTDMNWNFDEALITVYCPSHDKECVVRFNNEFGPCALRILDESDLSENWGELNMRQGWFFKVEGGGWFEQESQRDGFLMKHTDFYSEYLIIGLDACVSVLSKESPTINFEGTEVINGNET